MIDYITIGISILVLFLYLMIILMSIGIKKRLDRQLGAAFIYIIVAILFLAIRRVQQILFKIEIGGDLPYFPDFMLLVFTIWFSLAIFIFFRALKKVGHSKKSGGGNFQKYKRNLSKKLTK